MKAIVNQVYGTAEVLHLKELEIPKPKKGQVLVKIKAVSLNASDGEFLKGDPFYTRFWGLRKPGVNTLGSDIAGIVESLGEGVDGLKPGDAVFGDVLETWGGLAEYACAPAKDLSLKPADMPFEIAAAIPQAGLVALQGIQKGMVSSGQKVLINGAGGGSGSFAIQLAKLGGAHVTAVDKGCKADFMHSLGADELVDYQKENFTQSGKKYDLILDFIAAHSIASYSRSLKKQGRYLMVGGNVKHLFQTILGGALISLFSQKKLGLLPAKPNKGLDELVSLIESKQLQAVIDSTYPLEETAVAFNRLLEGKAKGKIVVLLA